MDNLARIKFAYHQNASATKSGRHRDIKRSEIVIASFFQALYMIDSIGMERYQARVNRAVDFVMRNLHQDLSLTQLAEVAHFSPFHFHRVFQASVGETVAEFVTRVRFERAILLMRCKKEMALTDIARTCGFRSLSNFSRAFKKRFQMSPKKADLERLIQVLPPVTQESGLLQRAPPDTLLRVEKRPSFSFFYKRVTGSYSKPQLLIDAYQRIDAWADAAGLSKSQSKLIGMSQDDPQIVAQAKCRYDFCRTFVQGGNALKLPADISLGALPESYWVICHVKGNMGAVSQAWEHLFRQWLPASGWQPASMPAMEVFHRRPEEIGWDQFDLDCCLPVIKLS